MGELAIKPFYGSGDGRSVDTDPCKKDSTKDQIILNDPIKHNLFMLLSFHPVLAIVLHAEPPFCWPCMIRHVCAQIMDEVLDELLWKALFSQHVF